MKNLVLFLFLLLSSSAFAQHTFYFDTFNTDDTVVEEYQDTFPLVSGNTYLLRVLGTFSIWPGSYWTATCGDITPAPIFPSAPPASFGNVGFDMEWTFSYPKQQLCVGTTFPFRNERIEISLDNGATWYHPTSPVGYNPFHAYFYTLQGQGNPLQVRHVSPTNSDDYGKLEFMLTLSATSTGPDKLAGSITVFPNPARDRVRVTSDFAKIESVMLTDVIGKAIPGLTQQTSDMALEIDVAGLASGTYFVTLATDRGRITKRLMVE